MKYWYFPGCSLKSTGRAYEESLLAIFKALDAPLQELDDWNCCGATSYMSADEEQAFALAARNLGLGERQAGTGGNGGPHLVAPCSACYMLLLKTQRYLAEHPDLARHASAGLRAVGLTYEGKIQVRHPLDVLVNDIGLERISKLVKERLTGLKVASYYGCQVVRPFATFDDPWKPTSMDRLVEALGGKPVKWPLKTRCCGGTLIGTIPEVGLRLSHILLQDALRREADVMITLCPLCQFNLECYQNQMTKQFKEPIRLSILYFTQLMGMAFGIADATLGMQRLFVPPVRVRTTQEGGRAVHV